jgi:hypothetical protein
MPTLEQKHEGLGRDRRVMQMVARHSTHEVEALGEGRWAIVGVYASAVADGTIAMDAQVSLRETEPEILAAAGAP